MKLRECLEKIQEKKYENVSLCKLSEKTRFLKVEMNALAL